VDTVDIEDISEKAVFCRCWRSENVSFFLIGNQNSRIRQIIHLHFVSYKKTYISEIKLNKNHL